MIAILLSLVWLTTRRALLVLFVSLGVFGWLCHGTASMMASSVVPGLPNIWVTPSSSNNLMK
jgi:hypothetical protein